MHIVPVREQRIAPETKRLGKIARRCRQPVAELVWNDDEVALGIEHAFPPDEPVDVGVMGAIGSGIENDVRLVGSQRAVGLVDNMRLGQRQSTDRKSTRLNSSHVSISYAVFCLKKKTI